MHIILGGTGHVGSPAARTLLAANEPVTVVTHDRAKAGEWEQQGATVAVADIHDPDAIRAIFRTGRTAFLLNPPAAPDTDTDAEERRTIAAILEALDGSGLERVVAESTFGAQPGERCGDLTTLYHLERGLEQGSIGYDIIRAAYYFSNWDLNLGEAREEGTLHTLYDGDFALPMVAPEDLGRTAARLLVRPAENAIHYVEGPRRYTPGDVAAAFADALGRTVKVVTTPRAQWVPAFKALGFSDAAAKSYAKMTGASADMDFDDPDDPIRGDVTLEAYIAALVARETVAA